MANQFRSKRKFVRIFVAASLVVFSGQAVQAGTIDAASFCVTDTEFRFSVDVTSVNEATGDVSFNIFLQETFLDVVGGTAPTEVIRSNFDRNCQVTRGNYLEVEESDGTPALDRVQNGVISNYALTQLSVGQCRVLGSIPHGANPYIATDTVADIFFREFNPTIDAHSYDVEITTCTEPPPLATPATPIPTMSQWALIMLSLLIGMIVFAKRRHLF